MPSTEHTPPPPDDAPCDCGGCRDFQAIHAGFSLELPWHERAAKRESDRVQQRRVEEYTAEHPQPMRRAV